MSEDLRICITIGGVDVSMEVPTRADGALPYDVASLLEDATTAALRAYKDSGIGLLEVVDDDDPDP